MSTGSDNCDDSENEERIVGEALGWGQEIVNKQQSKLNYNLVKIVDSKVSLKDIFEFFDVKFEEKFSPSGWTHYTCCPFPSHRDSSPSFYYNPKDNFFNCFGCSKKGRATNFVASYKNITLLEAAEYILDITSGINLDTLKEENKKNSINEINNLLLNFSTTVNLFIENNKSKKDIEFIEKITWSLDVYLHEFAQSGSVNAKHLKERLKLLQRKIIAYGG